MQSLVFCKHLLKQGKFFLHIFFQYPHSGNNHQQCTRKLCILLGRNARCIDQLLGQFCLNEPGILDGRGSWSHKTMIEFNGLVHQKYLKNSQKECHPLVCEWQFIESLQFLNQGTEEMQNGLIYKDFFRRNSSITKAITGLSVSSNPLKTRYTSCLPSTDSRLTRNA